MTIAGQFLQQGQHFDATLRVQRAGRLVGEDNLAAIHQGPRDGHTLLLTAGKLRGPMVHAVAETQRGQQRLGSEDALFAGHTGVDGRDFHVFHRRGSAEQVVALEHETKGFAAQPGQRIGVEAVDVPTRKEIGAATRSIEAAEDVHHGGLAGTRLADDGDEFARMDAQIDAAQRLHLHTTTGDEGTADAA